MTSFAFAANDPGHDTLYIEQSGDSELTGSLNITTDLRVAERLYSPDLDIRGDGGSSGATNRILGTSGKLTIETQQTLYLQETTGTGPVQVGTSGNPTSMNVTGSLYQNGVQVCLSDGTNCLSGNNTGNITRIVAGTGISVENETGSTTQISIDSTVCTTSNGLCGSASSAGGWTNTSTTTSTSLDVNITARATNAIPLVVHGVSGQTANLTEWRDSDGNIVASVAAPGGVGRINIGSTFNQAGMNIQQDYNQPTAMTVVNGYTGTAAKAQIVVGSALTGSNYGIFMHLGHGFTTSGVQKAERTVLMGADTEGLAVGTNYETPFILFTDKVERARFDGTTGYLGIGTDSPGEELEVVGDINATRLCIGTDCRSAWPSADSSSAAGWSNTSTTTSTALNVSVNGTMLIQLEGDSAARTDKVEIRGNAGAAGGQPFIFINSTTSNGNAYGISYDVVGSNVFRVDNQGDIQGGSFTSGSLVMKNVDSNYNTINSYSNTGLYFYTSSTLPERSQVHFGMGSYGTRPTVTAHTDEDQVLITRVVDLDNSYNNTDSALLRLEYDVTNPITDDAYFLEWGDVGETDGYIDRSGNMYISGSQVCTETNGLCGSASSAGGWSNTSTTTSTSLDVDVTARAIDAVPMTIHGATGQTANLQEWTNASGDVKASIGKTGAFSAGTGTFGKFESLNPSTLKVQGGSGNSILNTINGESGGVLLSTIKQVFRRIDTDEETDAFSIDVRGLFNSPPEMWYAKLCTTSGCPLIVDENQRVVVGLFGSVRPDDTLEVRSTNASASVLTVRGADGQTDNLQEWQDNNSAVLAYVNASGSIFDNSGQVCTASNGLCDGGSSSAAGWSNTSTTTSTSLDVNITARATNAVPLTINGISGQTADLLDVQNSSADSVVRVKNNGNMIIDSADVLGVTTPSTYALQVNQGGSSSVGLGVATTGFPYLTSTAPLYINRDGQSVILGDTGGDGRVGIGDTISNARLGVRTDKISNNGIVVRGETGQTANLQEWQNSSGGVLAVVDESGKIGIGTSTPQSSLTVEDSTGSQYVAVINHTGNPNSWGLKIQTAGTSRSSDYVLNAQDTFKVMGDGSVAINDDLTVVSGTSNPSIVARNTAGSALQLAYGTGETWDFTVGSSGTGGHLTLTSSKNATLRIDGSAGQLTNLTEWRNSGGTPVAGVNASGAFITPELCLDGDCQTSWPSGDASGAGGWTNTSDNTTTSLNVGINTVTPFSGFVDDGDFSSHEGIHINSSGAGAVVIEGETGGKLVLGDRGNSVADQNILEMEMDGKYFTMNRLNDNLSVNTANLFSFRMDVGSGLYAGMGVSNPLSAQAGLTIGSGSLYLNSGDLRLPNGQYIYFNDLRAIRNNGAYIEMNPESAFSGQRFVGETIIGYGAMSGTAQAAHTIVEHDALNSSVIDVVAITHSLDPASVNGDAGMGARMVFALPSTIEQAHYGQKLAGVAGIQTDPTHGSEDGALAFYTVADGAALAEHMRINTDGKVGIGTTSPSKTLEVSDGTKGITLDPDPDSPTINTTEGNLTITSATGYVIIDLG